MKSTMMFLVILVGGCALYGQDALSTELKRYYAGSKGDISKAAERMPDSGYNFKPAEGNTRNFGQIIGHIADVQLLLCGAAKGEQKRGDAEAAKTSKADLVAALKESFDYCDSAYDSLTDATATQLVKMFGRDQTRLGTLYFNVIHNNEMYGQIVTYFRAKDMVPPSTADRPNMGKKKQ
jgi:uncharacterized damage-inducible protein DinB